METGRSGGSGREAASSSRAMLGEVGMGGDWWVGTGGWMSAADWLDRRCCCGSLAGCCQARLWLAVVGKWRDEEQGSSGCKNRELMYDCQRAGGGVSADWRSISEAGGLHGTST